MTRIPPAQAPRGFREYLAGLLAPRDRNKTLTVLAGAEPVAGAQHPAVQRLQFFVSESRWDPGKVNARRLELLAADPATAPHSGGVLVIDDSGDRKDGAKTAHVGHQWLGRYGKTGNGVVTVTTLWADERLCYPVHAVPYTPARHFPKRKNDPAFRTRLQIGAGLAIDARAAGFVFRAVAATARSGTRTGSAASCAGPAVRSGARGPVDRPDLGPRAGRRQLPVLGLQHVPDRPGRGAESYLDPIWNHYIHGPVRIWSVDGGPDEQALAALEARDFGSLKRLTQEPADARLQLREDLDAALAHLREVHDKYWDHDWRRKHRGNGRYPENELWEAVEGYLDLLDASQSSKSDT